MANYFLLFLAFALFITAILDLYYNCMVPNRDKPNSVPFLRWLVPGLLPIPAIICGVYAFKGNNDY